MIFCFILKIEIQKIDGTRKLMPSVLVFHIAIILQVLQILMQLDKK